MSLYQNLKILFVALHLLLVQEFFFHLNIVQYIVEYDFFHLLLELYQYGLFQQQEKWNGDADYVLSGFAKALKYNGLNFNERTSGEKRIVSYSQIAPLSISEPMTWEDINNIVSENETVINGNRFPK